MHHAYAYQEMHGSCSEAAVSNSGIFFFSSFTIARFVLSKCVPCFRGQSTDLLLGTVCKGASAFRLGTCIAEHGLPNHPVRKPSYLPTCLNSIRSPPSSSCLKKVTRGFGDKDKLSCKACVAQLSCKLLYLETLCRSLDQRRLRCPATCKPTCRRE